MKKLVWFTAGVVVLASVLYVIFQQAANENDRELAKVFGLIPEPAVQNVIGTSSDFGSLATDTDPIVKRFQIGSNVDEVRLNAAITASSTTSLIDFQIGWSMDGTTFF